MADPKRMEAAFLWVSSFYGPEIGLPAADKPEDFWKEHILSLANLCKTKVARRVTADSAHNSYENAKEILKLLDQQSTRMNRWTELDPSAAAKGDKNAIYKFIVLLLHNLCNFVDDYITESQEFIVTRGVEKPFADLLSDVNNAGENWWQGNNTTETPSTVSSPIEKENSFGKYSIMDIHSTPRTPFQRRGPITPLSPVQRAIHSPVTVIYSKIRQEEYKRMRNKMVELEHTLDLEREDFMSLKKEAQQYKESAQEWREKYESSESMLKQLELERQQLRENMDKTKVNTEKLINQLRDYKRRVEKEVAESELLRRDRDNITDERDRHALAKADLEKKFQDLMDEHHILKENKMALDNLLVTATKQNEHHAETLREKANEVQGLREEYRLMINRKEEEYGEVLVREADLRLELQNSLRQSQELIEKLEEMENAKSELQNKLSDKDMELNEQKDSANRQIASSREASSRQIEHLEDKNRKMQFLIDQANNMIVEKEHAIQELREKLINDIGDVERLTAEKAKMQIELQDAQEQRHELRLLSVKFESQLDALLLEKLELEKKLEQKSLEILNNSTRMNELEKQMEPIIAKLKTSTPLIEVKEEMEEPLTSEKSIKIEPLDDYVEEKEEGADLSHMDWDNGEKVEYVMYSKSILGEESTNVVPSTENAFSQDVDKARVEELQRRNKAVPPCLRSSYALEVTNYESPSGEEISIKGARDPFRVPHTPQAGFKYNRTSRDVSPAPSRASNQSYESNKENSTLSHKPPPSLKKNRRLSFGIFGGTKKH